MNEPIPQLFLDDTLANQTLAIKNSFFDVCVASQLRALWNEFFPFADREFVARMREATQGLYDHDDPGPDRTRAYEMLHRCYWEMLTGCALLQQGVKLVPRSEWDRNWKGAGPDLWASVDGRRVWIECVAAGPGTGRDAVLDPPELEACDVPTGPINLRLLSVLKDKRAKYVGYVAKGIVRAEDAFVVAINSRGIPMAYLAQEPPWLLRSLYGLGPLAVNYDRATNKFADEVFLTRKLTVAKANQEEIDANLFGNGKAEEVSGVIYADVDAWNAPTSAALAISFIHNLTARVPLADRWLPGSTSYSVEYANDTGTVKRSDPK